MRYLKLIWLHVWIAAIFLSSTTDSIKTNAFFQHSHQKAFAEAAGLASFAAALVDLAVIVCGTRVLDIAWNQKDL